MLLSTNNQINPLKQRFFTPVFLILEQGRLKVSIQWIKSLCFLQLLSLLDYGIREKLVLN